MLHAKKIFLYVTLFLSFFALSFAKVEAKTIEVYQKFDDVNYIEDKGDYANCDGLLDDDAVKMIKEILGYFRILAPIILIVFVALDFGQAVLAQDNDALKKATSKVIQRAIAAAALFFIPTVIRAILDLPGIRDILVVDDPLCSTMNSEVIEVLEV